MRYVLLSITLFMCGCFASEPKPMCEGQKPFGTFDNLAIPYSGYYNLDSALACSRTTGRAVLAVYCGYNSVSDFHPVWNVLLDEDVKEIVDQELILAYLITDSKVPFSITAAQNTDTSILTVGHYYSQQQIDKYNSNSQPLYVLLDSNGDTLTTPIGYTPIEDKDSFIAFLNRGLSKWH